MLIVPNLASFFHVNPQHGIYGGADIQESESHARWHFIGIAVMGMSDLTLEVKERAEAGQVELNTDGAFPGQGIICGDVHAAFPEIVRFMGVITRFMGELDR